jgi:hypothetical protein
MSRSSRWLRALAITSALAGTGACYAQGRATVRTSEPPPPRVVVVQPRAGYVWVDGHWDWSGSHWLWRDGYWERERTGYVYVQGRWVNEPHGRRYVRGYWQVRSSDRRDHRPRHRVIDHR